MKRIIGLISVISGFLFWVSCNALHADELSYDALIASFHKSKTEAFEKAKAEGKYVFLMGGRSTCGNCRATVEAIHTGEVDQLIKESYVIWYIDWDAVKNSTNPNTEGKYYVDKALEEKIGSLPALFIIEPETENPIDFKWGKHEKAALSTFLDIEDRPVANEAIELSPNKTSIVDNTLFVSNNNANETITIYTLTGQFVSSFLKKETEQTFRTTGFPKGVLILSSSAGWSTKLMNK